MISTAQNLEPKLRLKGRPLSTAYLARSLAATEQFEIFEGYGVPTQRRDALRSIIPVSGDPSYQGDPLSNSRRNGIIFVDSSHPLAATEELECGDDNRTIDGEETLDYDTNILSQHGYQYVDVLSVTKRSRIILVENRVGNQRAAKFFHSGKNYRREKGVQISLFEHGGWHNKVMLAERFIDEHLLMISPCAAYGSLEDLLKDTVEKRLTLPEVETVAVDVSNGLEYLHGCNIIHRDVKPANIVLEAGELIQGSCRLLDYEMAKDIVPNLPFEDKLSGTPLFMAPEVWKLDRADLRSDLYAIGVTLYNCLTGYFPFDADNIPDISVRHLCHPVPDIRQHNSNAGAYQRFFERALAKDPADRYQTAGDLKRAFLGVRA